MAMQKTFRNPESTARIGGHPIHPMLIPFPIALFVSALVCDIAYWRTGDIGWTVGALWLIGGGLVMGALAAIAGLIDVLGDRKIRDLNDVWWHAGGNVFVVLIQLYNWFARFTQGAEAVIPRGIVLSMIVTGLMLFTGWKGWNMVYRHRVGVANEGEAEKEAKEYARSSERREPFDRERHAH